MLKFNTNFSCLSYFSLIIIIKVLESCQVMHQASLEILYCPNHFCEIIGVSVVLKGAAWL